MDRRFLAVLAVAIASMLTPVSAAASDGMAFGAGIDFAAVRATKVVQAVRLDDLTERMTIDGQLDEPAWARAPIATDFYQQEPKEGELSTERTEVKFMYDADDLYVGGIFYDRDPRGGISNEMKWDFGARDGDVVAIILDTFNDYNSYNFHLNPAGAFRDSQAYDDGRQSNTYWDGVWWGKTAKFPGGWSWEFKIPFKTLRFPKVDEQTWGMNIFRLMRRRNELTYWSPQPRQFIQYRSSAAGKLTGLRGIRPGRNLTVKPFATGRVSSVNLPNLNRSHDGDGGVDVKYGVGSALTLDASVRTDFSQVEVDEQQINLTRFSLFFPEKREFFLENQGTYRIGDLDASGQGTAGRRDLLPFFSRTIGLSPAGQPVPILAGVRLTGHAGDYSLGLLNMQTEAFGGRSGDNFTATHIVRNYDRSSVAGFYLGREGTGEEGHNRVVGGEAHVNFRQGMDLNGFVMASDTTTLGGGSAGRIAFNAAQNKYNALVAYTNISQQFRDDVGFVPRGDIGLLNWDAARVVRPRSTWLRSISFGTSGELFQNSGHDRVLSRHLRAYSTQAYQGGGSLEADVDTSYERLTEPFTVSKGVVLPPGEYTFRQVSPVFASNKSATLSGSLGYTGGEFYSGTIQGMTSGLRLRVNAHLALSGTYARNNVELPQGQFTTNLAAFRVDCSFTNRMFLNTFTQYNSSTSTWLANARFRLIYRPLSDFYLVYNELRAAGRPVQRTVALKHTILLSF